MTVCRLQQNGPRPPAGAAGGRPVGVAGRSVDERGRAAGRTSTPGPGTSGAVGGRRSTPGGVASKPATTAACSSSACLAKRPMMAFFSMVDRPDIGPNSPSASSADRKSVV